jgi:hypothetical protein
MKKLVLVMIVASGLLMSSRLAGEKPQFMARYLVSISRYIEWPSTMKSGDFKIGVVGDFAVYRAISEETMGAGIQHRNVDIMNLSKIEHIGITDLNMVILTSNLSNEENIKKALKLIGSKPTLLVTDKEGALRYGSAINFVESDNKLGFEINKVNATRNGIQISSQIDVFALRIVK